LKTARVICRSERLRHLDDRQLSSAERAGLARGVLAGATRVTAYAQMRMSGDCHCAPHYKARIS
jgi:hypothetical protein